MSIREFAPRALPRDAVDVVVVGAGISGLAGAVSAVQHEASVVLLEKGPDLGGTFRFSGGAIGGWTSYEDLRHRVPLGDPEMHRALTESLEDALQWLRTIPVPMTPVAGAHHYQGAVRSPERGQVFSITFPPALAAAMGRKVRQGSGVISCETEVKRAYKHDERWVTEVERADGSSATVLSKSLVLCSGGFQNSHDLMRRYMHFPPEDVWQRNSGYSDGVGLRIALENGGCIAGAMDTFYGHNLPAPPARFDREDLLALSQNYGAHAVSLNRRGVRYVDEAASPPPFEEDLSQATAQQPGGIAYYVFDSAIYHQHVARRASLGLPIRDAEDKYQAAVDAGGPTWTADSLQELFAKMRPHVPAEVALSTLQEYNRAVHQSGGQGIPHAKARPEFVHPIDTPPFYCVGVRAGVTLTMGGLQTDSRTRVLDRLGSPIAGFYSAGADVGNIHNFYYCVGNGVGIVFGRRAGREAASYARLPHAS